MERTPEPTYSTALSARAALLHETLAVPRGIDCGHNVDEVQAMVAHNLDLGSLEGLQQKEFTLVCVPMPSFLCVNYRTVDDGRRTAQGLLAGEGWRPSFLETDDVYPC